jgi:septal ring factor EnvC (AmiA/AmiB activator)
MISNFIWEHKWKALSALLAVGFLVLYIFFRSDSVWEKYAKWVIQKKKSLLKKKVEKKKEKIRKKADENDSIDKKIKELKEKNKKIEKQNKNKDLDELAKELKNMGL